MFSPLTPLDWKRRAVKYYPNKIAVIDGDKEFTYQEFGKRADQLSAAYIKQESAKVTMWRLCCQTRITCWSAFMVSVSLELSWSH